MSCDFVLETPCGKCVEGIIFQNCVYWDDALLIKWR